MSSLTDQQVEELPCNNFKKTNEIIENSQIDWSTKFHTCEKCMQEVPISEWKEHYLQHMSDLKASYNPMLEEMQKFQSMAFELDECSSPVRLLKEEYEQVKEGETQALIQKLLDEECENQNDEEEEDSDQIKSMKKTQTNYWKKLEPAEQEDDEAYRQAIMESLNTFWE